ncbi:hypothetical protein [Kitasatospora kifunensis]|uniref:Uncharacterized protein n=1 Tax=Kitasatospora kifunensis TaxID=58351 RepID=A0A7W7RBZ6_KITKI|nr:hypothetical protein [Kitasatospora kifunensis]MBB4929119.1 hypothetical protein [Kitasatospora kifunensis]
MTATPARGTPPLTRTELARRHNVQPSTVTRALDKAANAYAADSSKPKPPEPLNPDSAHPVYDPDQFDAWWPTRSRPGRRH